MIISDAELLEYIKEDLPYFDLTTYLQESDDTKASLEIFTRENIISSCTEEACSIAELLSCKVNFFIPSKQEIKKDEVLIRIEGSFSKIHEAYKLMQVLLEYSCKIATTTNKMYKIIKESNPTCELLTTRKSFPFSKKFCIKSILNGGAMPHRLGLSETILFFKQHRELYSSNEEFYKNIYKFKNMAPEKKIIVESSKFKDIKALLKYGVDVIQIDKGSLELVENVVSFKNIQYPNTKILVAGGINISNVQDYVKLGIDGVVTSSLYNCGMADLGVKLNIIK
ncbi:ModD protein [Halarcobacter mediterraneus]|uniref:Putative pyrophosphorylase ModD n=1 Tax=Halarcobacter mediterraneus TaxID=2023153 RepID=A0A4Q1AXD1_9BACT|nr:ModD protein [Halarcobacter mediterraneus]RXK13438.1 ModD protein [Halarcobacter mediterraneus]